jgi:Holliday junction resolvasome RuvABC endonuclease subunit
MADRIEKIVTKYGVTDIAVEDFFFSSKFTTGVSVNPAYRTAIYMRLRQMGLPYTILNISQWKSFIAGRSVPTKEQKLKYGKQPSKKIFIQQALWEKYSIRFPNHSLSENTGKPIKFRYDIVDAVAQCICFCRLHLNVPKIQCTVQNPPDVAFKKPFKDQFAYPSV